MRARRGPRSVAAIQTRSARVRSSIGGPSTRHGFSPPGTSCSSNPTDLVIPRFRDSLLHAAILKEELAQIVILFCTRDCRSVRLVPTWEGETHLSGSGL